MQIDDASDLGILPGQTELPIDADGVSPGLGGGAVDALSRP